jgi:hypothetical protein
MLFTAMTHSGKNMLHPIAPTAKQHSEDTDTNLGSVVADKT